MPGNTHTDSRRATSAAPRVSARWPSARCCGAQQRTHRGTSPGRQDDACKTFATWVKTMLFYPCVYWRSCKITHVYSAAKWIFRRRGPRCCSWNASGGTRKSIGSQVPEGEVRRLPPHGKSPQSASRTTWHPTVFRSRRRSRSCRHWC